MDSWTHEESVETQTNHIRRQSQHHDVDLDILDCHKETCESTLLFRVLICFSDILVETQLGDVKFLLGEAFGVAR